MHYTYKDANEFESELCVLPSRFNTHKELAVVEFALSKIRQIIKAKVTTNDGSMYSG